MKNYIIGMMLSLCATFSMAQPNNMQHVPIILQCGDVRLIDNALKSWGEGVLAEMKSERPDGKEYDAAFYVNPQNNSWTLVERRGENLFCIAAMGTEMKAVKYD